MIYIKSDSWKLFEGTCKWAPSFVWGLWLKQISSEQNHISLALLIFVHFKTFQYFITVKLGTPPWVSLLIRKPWFEKEKRKKIKHLQYLAATAELLQCKPWKIVKILAQSIKLLVGYCGVKIYTFQHFGIQRFFQGKFVSHSNYMYK